MSATVTIPLEDYNKIQNELSNLRATHEELYMRRSNNQSGWNYYKVMTKEDFIEEMEKTNETLVSEYRELNHNMRRLELENESLKNTIKRLMNRGLWDRIKNKKD